jgi:SWI/SNF-related matrix-associated actin-dependent regulator 1 of chromatin subfamily A
MLRRTKDILDLPAKSRQSLSIALDDKTAKEYRRAAEDFAKWVEANGGFEAVEKHMKAQAITKMTGLRHLAAVGKIDYAADWVVQHAEATNRPLVIMAHHRDVTETLIKRLSETEFDSDRGRRTFRVGKIIGGMAEAQRTADKDAFQKGDLDVLVCSIQAAGVGLTLTAASEILFIERAWRPSDLVQAEDRIHRIGQKNKATVTYLDAAGTIDSVIGAMLVDKQSTIAGIIDGIEVTQDQAEAWVFGTMFGRKDGGGGATPNPKQRALPFVDWQNADVF